MGARFSRPLLRALTPAGAHGMDHPAAGQGAGAGRSGAPHRHRREPIRFQRARGDTPRRDRDPGSVRSAAKRPLPQARECSYTLPVRTLHWTLDRPAADQLRELAIVARAPGILVVRFQNVAADGAVPWTVLEAWTRSRAVTVADIGGELGGAGLEVALCCDLVFVRDGASLVLPGVERPPAAGLLWALTRAGSGALARALLDGGSVPAGEAVRLGLAHQVVAAAAALPLPDPASTAALTSARDLMRSRAGGSAGRALELATFRLLFAAGDPEEGARAFLERRAPRFKSGDDDGDGHPASPSGSAVTGAETDPAPSGGLRRDKRGWGDEPLDPRS